MMDEVSTTSCQRKRVLRFCAKKASDDEQSDFSIRIKPKPHEGSLTKGKGAKANTTYVYSKEVM